MFDLTKKRQIMIFTENSHKESRNQSFKHKTNILMYIYQIKEFQKRRDHISQQNEEMNRLHVPQYMHLLYLLFNEVGT